MSPVWFVFDFRSSFPSNPYDEYDSDMVLDSMKEKMRVLLLKHEHGILCNEFMDVYAVCFEYF